MAGTRTPVPASELTWQQQALQDYNSLMAKGDVQLAQEWAAFYPGFHQAHPQYSVKQVFSAMLAEILAGGLSTAINKVTGVLGTVPGASAQAANAVSNPLDWLKYPADFFSRLTQSQTWIRVGEFAVGILLIYVGIKAAVTPGGVPAAAKSVQRGGKKSGGLVKAVVKKAGPYGKAASEAAKHAPKKKPVIDNSARAAAGTARNQQRAVKGLAPRQKPVSRPAHPKPVHH